jgi:hypothetical protein
MLLDSIIHGLSAVVAGAILFGPLAGMIALAMVAIGRGVK